MNKPPQPLANSARSGLTLIETETPDTSPLPPPGIESTADFAERVGAQFVLVEELKEEGASSQEIATAERMLLELMRNLRRRAPKGPPSFQEVPLSLDAHADIIGKLLHGAGGGGASRLARKTRQLARPFLIELLRPQQTFNVQLLAVIRDTHTQVAVSRHGHVPAWIRQTLEPLANPSQGRVQSHRAGLPAMAVRLAKKSSVESLRRLMQPTFERMGSWNHAAIEVLCAANSGGPLPTRSQAEQMMANLERLADPCPPGLRLPEPLRDLLALQREFTHHANQALARQLALCPVVSDEEYRQWCAAREPLHLRLTTQQARQLPQPPSFSVVVGAGPVNAAHWRECVASVCAQTHELWELVVAGPEPRLAELRGYLSAEQAQDSRIRFVPSPTGSGTASALNAALSAARGEAVAFLEASDRLAPHALAEVALALHARPTARLFYTDEDRLDGAGQRRRPFFKPDWSRDMQRECNYASRLLVARRGLCEELGGMRDGFEGAELMDLLLRASEKQVPISHVSSVLYHRRELPQAFQVVGASAHTALSQHLSRCGEDAEAWTTHGGLLRVRHRVKGTPRVSIIVPFKDKPELLSQLWRSFRAKTQWDNWQLILVSNNSVNPRTFELLDELEDPRILKLTWNHPFNYSAVNNFAARHADGELLLFLNNDIEVIDEGWMEELIAQAQRPEVGLVGPLLLFPNGLVQHAGVVLGPGGFATHPFWRYRPDEQWTPFGRMDHTRDYLAVTSACVMVRREVFEAVGGYDERFRVSGSDVELALRIVKRGLRCVYTPHTRLVHHESATRRLDAIPDRDAWLSYAAFRPWTRAGADPFYNPHLTLNAMNCGLRTDERSPEALAVQMLAWELPATLGMLGPS
ncbi:glycosyltransferase [Archangium gephyra]|uniref:glycosyltransferase n=1 Tax=Archangium gephyra TaxID=48 RepID=UPI0035D4EC9D